MSKERSDNTKTPQKGSITQRLRNDLGWSVRVNIAIQLVWLSSLRAQSSHSSQQPRTQNDTYFKYCKLYSNFSACYFNKEKKNEIWLRPMAKIRKWKVKRQHKDATKNFDYITPADRLRTNRKSNYSHPIGVVKPLWLSKCICAGYIFLSTHRCIWFDLVLIIDVCETLMPLPQHIKNRLDISP